MVVPFLIWNRKDSIGLLVPQAKDETHTVLQLIVPVENGDVPIIKICDTMAQIE